MDLEMATENHFESIIEHFDNGNKKSLIGKWITQHTRYLSGKACEFYTALAKHESANIVHKRHTLRFLQLIADNEFLNPLKGYFSSQAKIRDKIPESYSVSISNLISSYNSVSSSNVTAFTSLAGVIIGGLLAFLSALYIQSDKLREEHPVNTVKETKAIAKKSNIVDIKLIYPNKPIKQGLQKACSVPLRCTF